MKTNRIMVVMAILLIAGCFSTELVAQEAIKALVKRCETMNNVNISIVRNKNKDTKEVSRSITSIDFSNNDALTKEFVAAFEKERNQADQEMENRSNGKVNSLYYTFGNTTYSFSVNEDGRVSVSVIEKNDDFKYERPERPERPEKREKPEQPERL